jgi:hypothetical protein
MKPIEHVEEIEDAIHQINHEGHIRAPDEFVAMDALQKSVHALRCAIESHLESDDGDVKKGNHNSTAGEILNDLEMGEEEKG